MDSDGFQHGPDVYGAVFRLFRRPLGGAAGTAGRGRRVYAGFASAAFLSQHGRHDSSSNHRWTVVWDILSTDTDVRVTQPSDQPHHLRHWRLLRGHPWRIDPGDSARWLVHRASLLEMDLVEWCAADTFDDALHIPRHPEPFSGGVKPAQGQLARIPLRKPWIQPAFRRARPGTTSRLVSFRNDCRDDGNRVFLSCRRGNPAMVIAESVLQSSVDHQAQHTYPRRGSLFFSLRAARNSISNSRISRRHTKLPSAGNRPRHVVDHRAAVGVGVDLRATDEASGWKTTSRI